MKSLGDAPSASVLAAFGIAEAPIRFATGRGRTWAAGDVVLKPTDAVDEAAWIAEFAAALPQRGFRLPQPIATRDGRWHVDGWTAWTRLAGEHGKARWSEVLAASSAFHEAAANVPKPDFIDRQGWVIASPLDRWRFADRIVWGEVPVGDLAGVRHVDQLCQAKRDVSHTSQLIHGDLVGNVLYADGRPPGIIDLTLYWRPVGYSAALVVGDALTWQGAPPRTLRLLEDFVDWPQLLLRAVLFRVLVNELARRFEPWRADLSEEYRSIVALVRAAVGR